MSRDGVFLVDGTYDAECVCGWEATGFEDPGSAESALAFHQGLQGPEQCLHGRRQRASDGPRIGYMRLYCQDCGEWLEPPEGRTTEGAESD